MVENANESTTNASTLAGLVQQYGDILAQILAHGGEGMTPSQLSEPRAKLRTLLLLLLDLGRKSGIPRDLAAVVQLLKLTFQRLPNWVAGGGNLLLLELLDKLIPLMTHQFRYKHRKDLVACIQYILKTVAKTEKDQIAGLVQLFWSMFEDTYKHALHLSLDDGSATPQHGKMTNRITYTLPSALGQKDRVRGQSSELVLDSASDCCQLLCALLQSLDAAFVSSPVLCATMINQHAVISRVCSLLRSESAAMQTTAFQFLTTLYRALPYRFIFNSLGWRQLEKGLKHAAVPPNIPIYSEDSVGSDEESEENTELEEWYRYLTALFRAIADNDVTTLPVVVDLTLQILKLSKSNDDISSKTSLYSLLDLMLKASPRMVGSRAGEVFDLLELEETPKPALISSMFYYLQSFEDSKSVQDAFRHHANFELGASVNGGSSPGALPSRQQKRRRLSINDKVEQPLELTNDNLSFVICRILSLLRGHQSPARKISSEHSLKVQAELVRTLAPIAPGVVARCALDALKSPTDWSSAGMTASLDFLTSSLYALTVFYDELSSKQFSTQDQEDEHVLSTHPRLKEVVQQAGKIFVSSVRGESSAGAPSTAAALLLAVHCNLKLKVGVTSRPDLSQGSDPHTILDDVVMTVFEGARGSGRETQLTRYLLAPVATHLFSQCENASSWKRFISRLASNSQDEGCIAAMVEGMRLVMRHGKRPMTLLRTTMCTMYDREKGKEKGAHYDVGEMEAEETLDWIHATLEALFLRSPRTSPTPEYVSVILMFIKCALKSKRLGGKALKPLAGWLLECTNHDDAAVRSPVVSHLKLLAETIDEKPSGTQLVRRLTEMLQMGERNRKLERGALDALQTLTCLAHELKGVRILCLEALVSSLDHVHPVVAACGAQYLRGLASLEGQTVVELIFSMDQLVKRLGKSLLDEKKRSLLLEFAEVAGVSPSKLSKSLLPPFLLPELCAQADKERIAALASLAEGTKLDLFLNHGHHAIAYSFMEGRPPIAHLMPLVERLTGKDFMEVSSTLVPRTMSKIITQAAVDGSWGPPGSEVPMDAVQQAASVLSLLLKVTHDRHEDLQTPMNSRDNQGNNSLATDCACAASYLANGDHITRMLKQCSDNMERLSGKGDTTGMLRLVREIMIILVLAGQYVERYVPQLMVLLNTALKPCASMSERARDGVIVQALAGWQLLVKALDKQAPLQLRSTMNQIVVAVLNFLVDDDSTATSRSSSSHFKRVRDAALAVVETVVEACRRRFPEKIRFLPPLPLPRSLNHASSAALELLQEERRTLSTGERAALLLESLKDESTAVRTTALQELRVLLSNARDWGLGLFDDGHCRKEEGSNVICLLDNKSDHRTKDAEVLGNLRRVLLKVAEPSSASLAQQTAAAECLGMLAALDPTRIRLDPASPPPMQCSLKQLAIDVLCMHLVRMLKTAQSLKALDSTMLAIQDVLKCPMPQNSHNTSGIGKLTNENIPQHSAGAAGGTAVKLQNRGQDTRSLDEGTRSNPSASADSNSSEIFSCLPEDVQAIVRPYLDSRYALQLPGRTLSGVLYGSPHVTSFHLWLTYWLTQMVDKYVSGDASLLFKAIKPVFRFDVATAMFIAPYIIHNAVVGGGHDASAAIISEMLAVLDMGSLHSPSKDQDGLTGFQSSKESVLCVQAVYTLLDVLHRWSEDARLPQKPIPANGTTTTTSTTTDGPDEDGQEKEQQWDAVRRMLSGIPKEKVARSAAACGAHARALMHYEMALRDVRGGGMNPVASIERPDFADDEVSFLLEIYSRLEEPDGLEGLIKLRMGGPTLVDRRLVAEKTGAWGEALNLYERDLQVEGNGNGTSNGQANRSGYLNCLLQMGHWQSMLTLVDGMSVANTKLGSATTSGLSASGVAAAWRLGRWNQVERHLKASERDFPVLDSDARWELRLGRLLNTLKLETVRWGHAHPGEVILIDTDVDTSTPMPKFFAELDEARAEVMGHLSAAAMESYTRAYPHLVKLHMLQEIADVAVTFVSVGNSINDTNSNRRLQVLRWDERLALMQPSLSTQAPVHALRQQLATLGGFSEIVAHCWLQHARLCRARGHFDAAGHAVLEAAARGVYGAALEQAELLYARGEQVRAISDLQELDYRLSGVRVHGETTEGGVAAKQRTELRAQVLLRLGEWTAETGTSATDDIAEFFAQAILLRPEWDTGHFRYAAYLDRMMQDAKARQKNVLIDPGDVVTGNVTRPNPNRLDRFGGRARIRVGEDTPHLAILPEVLTLYGKSVEAGRRHIYRSLPRLLTLWYEFGSNFAARTRANSSEKGEQISAFEEERMKEVMDLMEGFSVGIPMDAWLTVLPQLISRICHPCSQVASLTRKIVTKVAQTYPQHAAWALAAVSKSTIAGRRSAATSIVSSARRGREDIKKIFSAMTSLSTELAKVCFHQTKGRQLSARRDVHLNLNVFHCPVMVPVMAALSTGKEAGGGRIDLDSESMVTLAGIQDHIVVMPSLQSPKRVVLLGSDGKEYYFLAKPKDDLRKDARMMEAAGVLNITFLEDADARRRQLYLRRFAVLPLAEDCGLVEWVHHTKSLRTCLNELMHNENLKVMQKTIFASYERYRGGHQAGGLQAWLEVTLRKWPARFHRWFLNTWHEPAAWFQARLGFTRTYAAWCMVGHMVGLGDRHGDNVLLDTMSGDAIQIDFGCLFDKGLILEIPEMVPFRLTQNIIDGFGIAGVEGVFRRACETTLRVLRKNEDTVLTIMETFVHDPLVEWAKNGAKVRSDGQLEAENPQAKDALATIKGRLRGTLLGVSSRPCMALSVEGHADWLIHEAASKENLSKMYIWWQAWY